MNAATKEAVAKANRRSRSSRDSARSSAGDDSDRDSGGGGFNMDSVKEVALETLREARRVPPDEAVEDLVEDAAPAPEDTAPAPAASSADITGESDPPPAPPMPPPRPPRSDLLDITGEN